MAIKKGTGSIKVIKSAEKKLAQDISEVSMPVVEKPKADDKGEVTATKYFNTLKSKKQKADDAVLKGIYDNCLMLLEKYNKTNQIDAMKKLLVHVEMLERERKVLAAGIDTFVYKDDVKKYCQDVKDRVVKMIELDRYEREIPDEIIATYERVKNLFDEFIIVFTDYTSEHVDKTNKERDPILFGVYMNDKKTEIKGTRMYFLGDWEDEYCDLTLDKLVDAMAGENNKKEVVFKLKDDEPVDLEAFRTKIKAYEDEKAKGRSSNFVVSNNVTNPSEFGIDENKKRKEEPVPVPSTLAVKRGQGFFKKIQSLIARK